jgi:hypothetical protein
MRRPRLRHTVGDNMGNPSDLQIDEIAKKRIHDANSVCLLFEDSLGRYATLLQALETEDLPSTRWASSLVTAVKDEFSRLRIWGEQTSAVLPQNARRSLDQQLREDEDTKQIVLRSLRRLHSHIERGQVKKHTVLQLMADLIKGIKQTKKPFSTAGTDTDSEERSSSSDEGDTSQEYSETAWEIRFRKIVNLIFEDIRSLYRISVLLRRPRNYSRYLRPRNPTATSYKGLEASADYAQVTEKIRQSRKFAMQSRFGVDEERKGKEFGEMADIAFFCQRLTWANLFRRKQFNHWINCPDVPESQERASGTVSDPNEVEGQTPSAIHASLSTDIKSALGDDTNVRQLQPVYTRPVAGRSNATRVPDVPKCSTTDPNFECPFCHIILDSGTMQRREIWK